MYLHFVRQRKRRQQSLGLIEIVKEFQGLEQTYPTSISCQNVQKICYEIHWFFWLFIKF
jgi:hypothetical protein